MISIFINSVVSLIVQIQRRRPHPFRAILKHYSKSVFCCLTSILYYVKYNQNSQKGVLKSSQYLGTSGGSPPPTMALPWTNLEAQGGPQTPGLLSPLYNKSWIRHCSFSNRTNDQSLQKIENFDSNVISKNMSTQELYLSNYIDN